MTDHELRKLSRSELLQMLIQQMKENEELNAQLSSVQAKLQERQIHIDKAGTLAEAALLLNGVFEAAEAASQQYMENIRQLSERQQSICEKLERENREKATRLVADAEEKSARLVADAEEKSAQLVAEAEKKSHALEHETKKKCDEMTTKAKEESEAYWEETSRRLDAFSAEHSELMELLSNQLLKRK